MRNTILTLIFVGIFSCYTWGQSSSDPSGRFSYMLFHTAVSQGNFGIALPLAYGAKDWRALTASNLIALPLLMGGHLLFVRDKDFSPTHLHVARTTTTTTLGLTYASSFTFLSSAKSAFRTGATVSLASYAAGLWGGYLLGEQYAKQPGGLAQHMLGIQSHALLGGFAGVQVAVLSEHFSQSWRAIYPILMGYSFGYLEGLIFYRNNESSAERHLYNAAGLAGGVAFGAGILLLIEDGFTTPKLTASVLTAGAFAGYLITNLITSNLTFAKQEEQREKRFSLVLEPTLETDSRLDSRPQQSDFRLRIPGFRYTFQ